jgi:hypothetical protein
MRGANAADVGEAICSILALVLIFVVPVAGWITHVVVCLKTASWGFLIAGAIFFPIGIIHGIGLWFGWF